MSDSGKTTSLQDLRKRIDQLDSEILEKLNERARCALDVAEVKLRESAGEAPVFYRPEREAQVLRRMSELNQGPLTNEKVAQVGLPCPRGTAEGRLPGAGRHIYPDGRPQAIW